MQIVVQATIASLPHYDEGLICLLSSQSQAPPLSPAWRDERLINKYNIEREKSPETGLKRSKAFVLCRHADNARCFQSDVVDPIWCGEGVEEYKKTSLG